MSASAGKTSDARLDTDALLALVETNAAQLTTMAAQLTEVARELRERQERKDPDDRLP